MSEPQNGETPPTPVDQDITDYFRKVVHNLLQDYASYQIEAQAGDQLVRAVALVSPPKESRGPVSYHYAYASVDRVEREVTPGLVVAKPEFEGYMQGVRSRDQYSRHYYLCESDKVVQRRDVRLRDGQSIFSPTLAGNMRRPDRPGLFRRFKDDVLAVRLGQPVPVQHLSDSFLHHFVLLNR